MRDGHFTVETCSRFVVRKSHNVSTGTADIESYGCFAPRPDIAPLKIAFIIDLLQEAAI
jgi:hypothetical protein